MNKCNMLIFITGLTVVYGYRYNFPGNSIPSTPGISGGNDRGTWNVGVNKDKGKGPQIHADANGNIWTSKNGNWEVNAGGQWDAGKGRKPGYNGNIGITGRWKRSVESDEVSNSDEISSEESESISSSQEISSEENEITSEVLQDDLQDEEQHVREVRRVHRPIYYPPAPTPRPRL